MSAIHNTLLITGLTLAVVLTVAWAGLLAYGLSAVIRALWQFAERRGAPPYLRGFART